MLSSRVLVMLMICAFIQAAVLADVPRMLSYQGKLTDAGQTIADGTCNMRFALYDQATGGSLLWVEPPFESSARAVPVAGGVFSVLMGSLVPIPETAFAGNAFLQVEVNGTVLTPRTQVVSVGYAYHALNAETVPDNSITTPKIANGTVTPAKLSTVGATSGQVLTYNGSAAAWANPSPLTLPYAGTANSASAAFSASNTGSGGAILGSAKGTNGAGGYFEVTNAANPSPALSVQKTAGSGNAANIVLNTAGGTGTGLNVQSVASGPVIHGDTISSGTVVDAVTYGSGKAGAFQISNANSSSSALSGTTNGSGSGVYGSAANNGSGVYGISAYGSGGTFRTTAGDTMAPALYAITSGIGPTATFTHGNTASGSPTLWVTNNDLGDGIEVDIDNANSNAAGIQVSTNAKGPAIDAYSTGSSAGVVAQNMGTGPAFKAYATGTSGEAIVATVTKSANGCSAILATSKSPSATINATNTNAAGEAGMFQIDNSNSAGTALHAKTNGTGKAGYFEGDVEITGKASGPYLPVAFGVVSNTGSKVSGTPNFTSTAYDDGYGHSGYTVTVDGFSCTDSTIMMITPHGWDLTPMSLATTGGKMLVYFTHAGGGTVPAKFSFVIYRAP